MLTFAQVVHTHDLPIRELQRIVMHTRLVRIDLSETSDLAGSLRVAQQTPATRVLDIVFESDLCPWEQAHSHMGSPTAAKPRVIELLNVVETNLSSSLAGRDLTLCRL